MRWQHTEACTSSKHTVAPKLPLPQPSCPVRLRDVLLCSRFPDAPLMAAGYSLGSVLLAKYLAEADNGLYLHLDQQQAEAGGSSSSSSSGSQGVPEPRTGSGLVAAALVSPPVCLHTTNSKMGRPYTAKFLYNLAVAYKWARLALVVVRFVCTVPHCIVCCLHTTQSRGLAAQQQP